MSLEITTDLFIMKQNNDRTWITIVATSPHDLRLLLLNDKNILTPNELKYNINDWDINEASPQVKLFGQDFINHWCIGWYANDVKRAIDRL